MEKFNEISAHLSEAELKICLKMSLKVTVTIKMSGFPFEYMTV